MKWLFVFYLPFFLAFVVVAKQRGGLLCPDSLFVFFNTIALFGVLSLVSPYDPLERRYAYIVLACLIMFTLTCLVTRLRWPSVQPIEDRVVATPLTTGLWVLYFASLAVCFAYYIAVGHIALLGSLDAISSGGRYDIATERLASYAGADYFFPGYVNQFKNSILPIVSLAIVHNLWTRRAPGRTLLCGGILLLMLVMVAGTGQRGASVLVFLIGVTAAYRARFLSGIRLAAAGAIGFLLFSVLTLALQRQSTELQAAQGTLGRSKVFLDALWSRAVLENPATGITAFHYTQDNPIPVGSQWLIDAVGILPGYRGSDLANRVFEVLTGSRRGTAPESNWGGMYYNFGGAGTLAVTVLFALLLTWLTRRYFLRLRDEQGAPPSTMSFLSVLSLAGMAVTTGSWIAGTPMTFVNTGFFAYLFVHWFSRRLTARHAVPTTEKQARDRVLTQPNSRR